MIQTTQRPKAGLLSFSVICAICIAVAYLINWLFGQKSLVTIALDGEPLISQITWGTTFGISIALAVGIPLVIGTVYLPTFAQLRSQLVELAERVDFSGLNPLWISMFAGLGEEVLFRGAIQPAIGLWWASVVFVLLHSGTYQLRSLNWKKAVMATLVFAVSLLLGYIFLHFGLLAAIITHVTLDVVALFGLQWLVLKYGPNT